MAPRPRNQDLRRLHARGKRALAKREVRQRQGKGIHGTLDSLGASTPAAKNRLFEACRFAELYDDRQLEWLCSLRDSEGRPLTKSHVLQLIRVTVRRQRDALARECVAQAWSARRLQMGIDRIEPRRHYGGRTYSRPQSVHKALVVTEHLAASWLRWVSVVKAPRSGAGKERSAKSDLPEAMQEKLDSVADRIAELYAAVGRRLERRSSEALVPFLTHNTDLRARTVIGQGPKAPLGIATALWRASSYQCGPLAATLNDEIKFVFDGGEAAGMSEFRLKVDKVPEHGHEIRKPTTLAILS